MSKIKKLLWTAFLLRLVLLLISSYHPDLVNHIDWGEKFWQYGAKNFYEQIFWRLSWPNQPLGTIVLFAVIAKLSQWLFSLFWWLNLKIPAFPSLVIPFLESRLHVILLKAPFILADLGIGWLIYRIVLTLSKEEKKAYLGAALFLLNPAILYNSAVWGQTDSLVNLLALLSLWLLFKRKYYFGVFLFLFGFYFKLSLLIWLPIAVFIVLRNKDLKKTIFPLLLTLTFLLLVSLPFVHHGNVFSWLWYLYTNRILPRQGNMLSGNAFNFWTLIYGVDLGLKENLLFLGISAKKIGLFFTSVFWLIYTIFYLKIRNKNFLNYLWLMVIFSFSSFLFLTNMHERYLYPVFAPLAILAATGKFSLGSFATLSLIHLINLYHLWWYPKVGILQTILEQGNFFLARIFSLVLIVSFLIIFQRILKESS